MLCLACALAWPMLAQNIELEQVDFRSGGVIRVHFTAPTGMPEDAWLGIIPSNVPHGSEARNDKHDVAYQYLKGRTMGTLTFHAPSKAGTYDFRMHNTDNDGKEIASVSFTVDQVDNSMHYDAFLQLDQSVYAPGSRINLHFTAPGSFAGDAWIGVVPADIPHGSEAENDKHDLSYQYLQKRTAGSLTFMAPSEPGEYDFRMHSSDKNGKEVFSVSFVVE